MAENLVPSEAGLKPAAPCEGWAGPLDTIEALSDWRDELKTEILRATPQVIFAFGALDAFPTPLLKGAWYRFAFRLGASGHELALEISKFDISSVAVTSGSRDASVTCLVHERWLAEFDASMRDSGRCGALQLGVFHLPSDLRAIAAKGLRSELTGAARVAYRTGKGLELLCETAQLWLQAKLVALHAGSGLSATDMQRLFSAKRTIVEQFEKKLTLDSIGRACGLNRAKLTRGFKTVFGISIAEALSEERLLRASVLLQTTNKPVSNIGYAAGYLNNASFARAFARRFGVCPSEFRLRQLRIGHDVRHPETLAA
jgi:AraC-like DNA-binding protein